VLDARASAHSVCGQAELLIACCCSVLSLCSC
jgi:hypothetical protein